MEDEEMRGKNRLYQERRKWRYIISTFLILWLWSGPGSGRLQANEVGIDRAQRAAQGWLRSDNQLWGADLDRRIGKVIPYPGGQKEVIYYIATLEPQGFLILPADDRMEPVVCFSQAGALQDREVKFWLSVAAYDLKYRRACFQDPENLQSPQVRKAVLRAEQKWEQLTAWGEDDGVVTAQGVSTISDVRVAPLTQSEWGQTTINCLTDPNIGCYNYYIPPSDPGDPCDFWVSSLHSGPGSYGHHENYPCGCVATGMAQLMYFHKHPQTGIGKKQFQIYVNGQPEWAWTRGGDGLGGSYKWSDMTAVPNCTNPVSARQAIGALCYDAGVSVNMRYSKAASKANLYPASRELGATFLYNNSVYGQNGGSDMTGPAFNDMVNTNLDFSHPVILCIAEYEGQEEADAHAVLADGYGYHGGTLYHHLNMGWSGRGNVWYHLPLVSGTGYFYQLVIGCIYNVYPSGTGEIISGLVLDQNGQPVSGAAVTAQGPGGPCQTTSNSKGIYVFAKLSSNSSFALGAAKSGYSFAARQVTTGTSTDFSAASGNRWGVDLVEQMNLCYVDDNAPGDPCWYNPLISDPLEDGTIQHPFDAIQEGIDAVSIGGTVIVLPGSFTGKGNRDIDYRGKIITVRSIDPNDPGVVAATIVDSQGTASDPHQGFYFGDDPNSYVDPNAVLAGLTIINGHIHSGGGIFCVKSSPTIINCVIKDNTADYGGGMRNLYYSRPILIGCTFRNNTAYAGGAMYNDDNCNVTMIRCDFIDNYADWYSGGIINVYSSGYLINCRLLGNTTPGYGGGMHNSYTGTLTVINCLFSGNTAGTNGAGMSNYRIDPELINCTFGGNQAGGSGGGLYNEECSAALDNCILWGNQDSGGTDETAQIHNNAGSVTVTYSCVQDANPNDAVIYPGAGNIDDDPKFKDADGGDNKAGTEDDNLRLKQGSPCIDAGNNLEVPADQEDLDEDMNNSERIPRDLDGRPRFINDPLTFNKGVADPPDYWAIVDMGAYEFSYIGDFNFDGYVDLSDYAILAWAWKTQPGDARWNIQCDISIPPDDKIDLRDLWRFCQNWLISYTPAGS